MRFVVGGQKLELSRDKVVAAMQGVPSEPIRTHSIDIDGQLFPPKQVFATITGRARTSFTTMEAQRVLHRLGFSSRATGARVPASRPVVTADREASIVGHRLDAAEATLAILEAAVAGLLARVKELEASR